MHSQITKRSAVALFMLASVALAAACSNSALTDPTSTAKVSAHRASMDDDPALCRSGFTVVDGHTICNP
jgi:hypothetical protein